MNQRPKRSVIKILTGLSGLSAVVLLAVGGSSWMSQAAEEMPAAEHSVLQGGRHDTAGGADQARAPWRTA